MDFRNAKELLELFLEYHPDIRFHLEIHPALLSEELKEELKHLPEGLLHLEAGIQSLREPVLEKSRRMGKLTDALEGLKFLCSLPAVKMLFLPLMQKDSRKILPHYTDGFLPPATVRKE